MTLNFEVVVSDQFFSVLLAAYKWFKTSAPGVGRRHMWQLDYLEKLKFLIFEGLINSLSGSNCGVVWMQNLKLFSWNGFKLVQTTWSVKQQNWKWSGSIFWKTTFTASLWYHVINWQIDCFSTELPRWIHARTGNNN